MNPIHSHVRDQELATLLRESDELVKEGEAYLQANGEQVHFSEWVTIKEYAKRHNLESTNVVSNWIKRNIIPATDIRDFPYLNDLRLIRDKEYK